MDQSDQKQKLFNLWGIKSRTYFPIDNLQEITNIGHLVVLRNKSSNCVHLHRAISMEFQDIRTRNADNMDLKLTNLNKERAVASPDKNNN